VLITKCTRVYNILGGVSPVIDDAVMPQSLDGVGNAVNFVA
jgi:hypothetical protein